MQNHPWQKKLFFASLKTVVDCEVDVVRSFCVEFSSLSTNGDVVILELPCATKRRARELATLELMHQGHVNPVIRRIS